METVYFLGIDVSKAKFNSALTLDGKNFHELQVENNSKSIAAMFKALKLQISSLSNLVVCMEHTGVYCLPLLNYLSKNQVKVCVEPALQIKQSQGMTRGKNDQLDAKRIALYAFKNYENLQFWKPQRLCIQKLKSLLVTRERLVKMKAQLGVPLREGSEFIEESIHRASLKSCQKTIKAVDLDIQGIEKEIADLVDSDSHLQAECKLITSVPGIGKITALNLIVSTGEFTRIREPKKLACYAGIAPFEHSSGSSIRGKSRVSRMANMTLKRLLHLAAMSAIQCCDELRDYYVRKIAAGKNKMSVLNAVRNKLISRVYACIKQNRPYQKIHQNALA